MSERILTAAQVAELFQVDRETVYKLAQRGRLPGFKVGYQWRFAQSTIQDWYVSWTSTPSGAMPLENRLQGQEH